MAQFGPMPARLRSFFNVPLLRRIAYHARRVSNSVDRHFFFSLAGGLIGFVVIAALAVTLLEPPITAKRGRTAGPA